MTCSTIYAEKSNRDMHRSKVVPRRPSFVTPPLRAPIKRCITLEST
jgi:hypothetical protein